MKYVAFIADALTHRAPLGCGEDPDDTTRQATRPATRGWTKHRHRHVRRHVHATESKEGQRDRQRHPEPPTGNPAKSGNSVKSGEVPERIRLRLEESLRLLCLLRAEPATHRPEATVPPPVGSEVSATASDPAAAAAPDVPGAIKEGAVTAMAAEDGMDAAGEPVLWLEYTLDGDYEEWEAVGKELLIEEVFEVNN